MLAVCVAVKELPDTEWDSLGYLTRLSRSESQETISLAHDVFGNLATLTAGGQTTTFLWDDASGIPSLLKAGNHDIYTTLGYTAYGTPQTNTGWVSHGWREARPTNPAAPWGLPPVIAPAPVIASEQRGTESRESLLARGRSGEVAVSERSERTAKQSPVASPWNILPGGSVSVAGLELMGARTYDPLPPIPSTLVFK